MEKCCVCGTNLKKTDKTKVKGKKTFCLPCYQKVKNTRCGGCGKPILGEKLFAMEKEWHPEHFKCSVCKKVIEDDTFAIFENQPICNACKNSNEPINSDLIKRCKDCSQTLIAIKYFLLKGEYFCEACYQKTAAPKCSSCKDPIMGKWVTANGKTWHAEHFTCHKCKDNLIGRPFSFKHGELICVPCFKKYILHKTGGAKPIVDRETLDETKDPHQNTEEDTKDATHADVSPG